MAISPLFLLILTATFSAAAADSASMNKLLTNLSPTPTNWAVQSDYCFWSGVQCDPSKSVVAIDLTSQSISGNIQAVGNLTNLIRLKLADNRFTGRLPDLSGCTPLKELDLRGNLFTGPVFLTAMPPNLKNVSLDGNFLQGPLPEFSPGIAASVRNNSFCKATPGECDPQVMALLGVAEGFGYPLRLAQTWLGNDACSWDGVIICDIFGNVVMLTVDDQMLGGIISPEFGNLRHLRNLILRSNGLWGYIPEALTNLPELQLLDVSENKLFGQVPAFRAGIMVLTYGNPFLRPATAAGNDTSPPVPSRPSAKVGCWGTSVIVGLFSGLVIGVVTLVVLGIIMVNVLDRTHRSDVGEA